MMMKSVLFISVVIIGICEVIGHADAPASSDASISADETNNKVSTKIRRSIYSRTRNTETRNWQYEGLPIEFPGRRRKKSESSNEIIKKSDTKNLHKIKIPTMKTKHHKKATVEVTLPTSSPPTFLPSSSASPPIDRRYRRIYNPDETATAEEFPFMAALLVNMELWCGAVIISREHVLTAAHCLQLQYNNRFFREYVKMLSLRMGSSNATAGGELYRVSEIFFHPNYKPQTLEFNVALLKVHKNMTFGKAEPKIDMIEYSLERSVPVDSQVMFLGWGAVMGYGGSGGQVLLQKVELPVYDIADCQEVYGRDLVSRNNFCAGYITIPKNVCNHDAGGPAIMDGKLIGILSFSSKRCDQIDQPAVFTTVGSVVPWLEGLAERKYQLRNTVIKAS